MKTGLDGLLSSTKKSPQKEKPVPVKKEKEPAVHCNFVIDKSIHTRMKYLAIEKNMSLRDIVNEAMRGYWQSMESEGFPHFLPACRCLSVRTEQPGIVTCLPWTAPCVREHTPLASPVARKNAAAFGLQRFQVDVLGLTLYLKEGGGFLQFVFRHDVNLVFPLTVPPASDAGKGLLFYQHALEIAFKDIKPLEGLIPVPVHYRFHTSIVLYLQHVAVFVDEAEPEREEVVLYRIADILGGTLFKEGLLLSDDLVLIFQFGQVSANFLADDVLNFRTGCLSPSNGRQD